MKTTFFATLGLALLSATALADEEQGARLFDELCVACHIMEGEPQAAPPVFGVINHVRKAYPQKEAFVRHIVDWVASPDAESALMPGAVRRFGLMPKLGYADEDVAAIAEFWFEKKNDLPGWYREHYEQEHGTPPPQ